jgi:hypothetical protein
LTLGSTYDFFVPDGDMPDENNSRGYTVSRDINTTYGGNTFVYEKSKIRKWSMSFNDVSTATKDSLDFIANGFFKQRPIGICYYGSLVTAGATPSTMFTQGQCWGTCLIELDGMPKETAYGLWSFGLNLTEYGTEQAF